MRAVQHFCAWCTFRLWQTSAMEREKVDRRVPFETSESQLEAIDQWRGGQRPIPSRNEAIRRLVDIGLGKARAPRRRRASADG